MLRALALTAFLALAACSSGGSTGTPDAGNTAAPDAGTTSPDAGTTPDAGTAPCTSFCKAGQTSPTDCTCVQNTDCNPGFRCGEVDNGTCECGPRGTGKLSDPCTSANDCETALCLDTQSGDTFCTKPCQDSSECSGTMNTCNGFLGLCADR